VREGEEVARQRASRGPGAPHHTAGRLSCSVRAIARPRAPHGDLASSVDGRLHRGRPAVAVARPARLEACVPRARVPRVFHAAPPASGVALTFPLVADMVDGEMEWSRSLEGSRLDGKREQMEKSGRLSAWVEVPLRLPSGGALLQRRRALCMHVLGRGALAMMGSE
jgi:hypothetical protein